MNPEEKCTIPTNLACTMLRATGVYNPPDQMSAIIGVLLCMKMIDSNNSCQYPLQLIRNMNPVAHTKCDSKNSHDHTLESLIVILLYPLISGAELNHK